MLMTAMHTEIAGYRVIRDCNPRLWHLFHKKFKWKDSVDGLLGGKVVGHVKFNLKRCGAVHW